MNFTCVECGAFHWLDERVKHSPASNPIFSRCCHHGKVKLESLPEPPDHLRTLFTASSTDARQFREHIRQYNSALAFTSFTAKDLNDNSGGGGPPVWKSGYTIYHQAGSLFPVADRDPKYAQLYFYDPAEALDWRMRRNSSLKRETMDRLQNMLLEINRYRPLFLHAFEVLQRTPNAEVSFHIVADSATDLRRYNPPAVDEFAVVLPGDHGGAHDPRNIVMHGRGGQLSFIHDHHHAYAPLHYVLFFPYGTSGWTYHLPLERANHISSDQEAGHTHQQKDISQVQYYCYRLHVRMGEFPIIQSGGRLFQQYVCDVWVSTDQNRLRWIENNQPTLRAALYNGLEDAVGHGETDVNLDNVGHRVVLPSSYTGGPRYMNQRFQDAIALARFYHGFDLFVTFTCNSHWPEISAALLPGQSAADRPDITVRVFQLYKTALVDFISKQNVFGTSVGHVYTIEFQKRGLPHMHLLLALAPSFRLETPDDVDTIIRATWPDPVKEPRLFAIVKRSMVHGPCGVAKPGASCMKNGKCSKGFPKNFQAQTVMTRNGYPIYARPDDGREYEVRGFLADNRWIVPYNPRLLSLFDAHINVECVMSLAAAKYITKYTHKGPDRATLEIQRRNEVSEFRDSRYIAASEAAWRMFEFPIHHQEPPVMSLQIHLPGQHLVVFNANDSPDVVTARASQERTMLTAFFDLNRTDPSARVYTYQELPLHFVWDKPSKRWKPRQRGATIGRIFFVSPTAGERFYLRTLLTTVKGPCSWDHLRTVGGVLHPTFHAACLASGLLANDDEWRECLQEASLTHVGESLRRLFSLILRHCEPSQPDILWSEFRDSLCDDLNRRLQRVRQTTDDVPVQQVYDYGLHLIDKDLHLHGSSLSSFPSMPRVHASWDHTNENPFLVEQLDYDTDEQKRLSDARFEQLNDDQRRAFHQIYGSVNARDGKLFFLHGPGGTGKTFVYGTLCHRVRSNGWIVLCVASSGIASLLLPGGHTAHSTFSIPVMNLADDSSCPIDKNSKLAEMLRQVRLIVWDEAVTQHRHAIEAVDRTLQDIRSDPRPFGGITVVFGGDFQQTLPVVPKGCREDIVNATLQHSLLWAHVNVLHLRENMRVHNSSDAESFSRWLLDIGHGRANSSRNLCPSVPIPESMRCRSESELIQNVYGDLNHASSVPPPQFFEERAILTSRNEDVRKLNSRILDDLPGEERIYNSADSYSIDNPSDIHFPDVPLEFLHDLNASGLPLAHLRLKIGCPLILLRNIDKKHGLCNGTRATLTHMSNRLLQIRLISGDHAGQTALIPRISLTPSVSDVDFVIKLNRRQFPVQLAFAMTINKAQGQTVKRVGVDVRKPVFSHGQLYVAFSRAANSRHIKVLLPDDDSTSNTPNVVYPEILLD